MADFNAQRMAQALMGPREGKLTPENENAYQTFMAFDPNVRQWRNQFQNRYGEQPSLNDPSFDYRQAFMAGNRPQEYAGDPGMMHWDSRGKSPDHPTAWMNDFMGRFGVDPIAQAQTGYTPEQSQMVNNQLSQDLLSQLLMRQR